MRPISPPDCHVGDREYFPHAPSWAGSPVYLNDEHRGIFQATKDLPGWQDPADSEKLYELGYRSGSVILEVGVFGGRSAVVEMRGALAAARDLGLPSPQYYGVDVDPSFFQRSYTTIAAAGLAERCLLFHGDLARFLRELPIIPTMVFVDGDHRYPGCWADLRLLSRVLLPGTPMLCHDYGAIPGVRRAVDEWIECGAYESMGCFAGSVLLRATGAALRPLISAGGGQGRCLSEECFALTRESLVARYSSPVAPCLRTDRHHTPVRDLTRAARLELLGAAGRRRRCGRASWPYAPDPAPALPPTMPGGAPWPRISVVTPTFNQGCYIEETLLSVRNQGYPAVDHIIVDGGSTDETMAIVDRYRDALAAVVSEKDDGQSDAINKGMKLATGEILTWLNSDDMLAPGALAAVALAFHESGADLVAGECHVHRDGRFVTRHLTSCENGPLPLQDLLDIDGRWLEGQFFYQPEVMFTREIWEKAGGHVRTDLYHSMDYELWARMAAAGARLNVIGRPVAFFRAHPDQKTAGDVVGGFRTELPKARAGLIERLGLAPPAAARPGVHRPRLRVVLFNDLGYAYGAGIAHRRMAEAFLASGHEVFAVAAASKEHHASAPKPAIADVVARIAVHQPDLVVVGNLHGADLDPALLGAIADRFPTAVVLHDLWLLTGRCAYTNGCREYLKGCGDACTCDRSHPKLAPELVRPAWETKRQVLTSAPDLHIWANSEWALAKANEAIDAMPMPPGRPAPVPITFGLELDVFRPRDKFFCREQLNLPRDKFIIMSSSSSLADPRKGLKHLADALELLRLEDTLVVCVGWFNAGEEQPIPGMRAMGYMDDPRRLAMLYSAADVFVGPSLEEAFGQVFIEAAACGTPSIGYPVGGKPQAIRDGISGILTEKVDPAQLADAIETLYMDPDLRASMGEWARIWAENRWSMGASAHSMYCAMRRQGLVSRLGMLPRLNLQLHPKNPPPPATAAPIFPAWRAVSGFDHWEGPYPDRGLPRCRWAHGPVARFELPSDSARQARVLIACRCFEHGQRVRLVHAGRVVGERDIPPDMGSHVDRILAFDLSLAAGDNPMDLHIWKWQQGPRPLGILITAITVVEARAPASLNGSPERLIEPKPAAAGVR